MSIRHTSFKHGWFYHYRFHVPKLAQLCCAELSPLVGYMEKMMQECPDHYFLTEPRSSALRFDVSTNHTRVEGHEVSKLAELAVKNGRYRTAHSNVEVFMLENDANTIGVELPVWLYPHELDFYRALFNCEEPLSGHIDLLRVEDDNIWIWDYKPNADKEKYASCQVLFYAIMLSKRTGIPLDRFRCGYFDEASAYIFKPSIEQVRPELKILA